MKFLKQLPQQARSSRPALLNNERQRTEREETEVYRILKDSEKTSREQIFSLFHSTGRRGYKTKFSKGRLEEHQTTFTHKT